MTTTVMGERMSFNRRAARITPSGDRWSHSFGSQKHSFGLKEPSLFLGNDAPPADRSTNCMFRPRWQGSETSGMQSERKPKAYSYTRFSTPEQAKGDSSTRQALV